MKPVNGERNAAELTRRSVPQTACAVWSNCIAAYSIWRRADLGLGSAFTSELREAWIELYEDVQTEMINASKKNIDVFSETVVNHECSSCSMMPPRRARAREQPRTRAEDNAMIAAKLISAPSVPIRHAVGGLVADGITPRPPSRHLIEQSLEPCCGSGVCFWPRRHVRSSAAYGTITEAAAR
jgi:hypothetical protein